MLSIERCREILGNDLNLTDEEIGQLRDHLYAFAEAALDLDEIKAGDEEPPVHKGH